MSEEDKEKGMQQHQYRKHLKKQKHFNRQPGRNQLVRRRGYGRRYWGNSKEL